MNIAEFVQEWQQNNPMPENYQAVIIKTLLESDNFTASRDHVKAQLDRYNPAKTITDHGVGINVLEQRNIVKSSGDNIHLELDERDETKIIQLVCHCNRIIWQKADEAGLKRTDEIYLAQGDGKYWYWTIKNLPLRWGAEKETGLVGLKSGDFILFRAHKDTMEIDNDRSFGFGVVKEIESNSTAPYWESEKASGVVKWKYRVIIDPLYYVSDILKAIHLGKEGYEYSQSFFHITDSDLKKNIVAQMEKTDMNPDEIVSPSDVHYTLETLIESFDGHPDYFAKQKLNESDFNTKLQVFQKEYFDFEKIKNLTEDKYAAGKKNNKNFCDDLKELLQETHLLYAHSFGIYYKDDQIQCHRANFNPPYLADIQKDLKDMMEIREKTTQTIIDSLGSRKHLIPSTILMAVLFLMKPEKFLSISEKATLANSLKRFGKDVADKNPLKMQAKLIEIKLAHPIMKKWSNYDFSYFLRNVEKLLSNQPRYLLCKFTGTLNGQIGSSYEFDETSKDYKEIQENAKIIFFDEDQGSISFWGNGNVASVTFDESEAHRAKIDEFEGYGITEGKASLTQPLGKVGDELEQRLKKEFEMESKEIISIGPRIFDEIRNGIGADKPFNDAPLSLPDEETVQKAIDEINEELLIEPIVIKRIIAALYSGKSLLLTGPIGCGKTALAQMIPTKAWGAKLLNDGYYGEVVTATDDWGTHDVIGGIVPKLVKKDSDEPIVEFRVQMGVAAKTISENWPKDDKFGHAGKRVFVEKEDKKYRGVWLIIDEFNRADIDKAFGGLFTALEYRKVGLKIPTDDPYEISERMVVPQDYRIIGTLNTRDKNFLHHLSDALNRRFETIEISPPEFEQAEDEMTIVAKKVFKNIGKEILAQLDISSAEELIERDSDTWKYLVFAYEILAYIRRSNKLGTALLIAVYKFILVFHAMKDKGNNYEFDYCLDLALCNSIIPQISKLPPVELQFILGFISGNISGEIYRANYTDDDESQERLKGTKELVSFINDHKADKEKLKWDKWNEYLSGTKKDRDDDKRRKLDDQARVKHSKGFDQLEEKEKKVILDLAEFKELNSDNLNPWPAIITMRNLKDAKRPKLEEFRNALLRIIRERKLEDFEDEFSGWSDDNN